MATQFIKSDITLPPGKAPGTDCPVEFFGFFGTRKFERVTPSNAFKKTHRQVTPRTLCGGTQKNRFFPKEKPHFFHRENPRYKNQ